MVILFSNVNGFYFRFIRPPLLDFYQYICIVGKVLMLLKRFYDYKVLSGNSVYLDLPSPTKYAARVFTPSSDLY